MNPNIHGRRSRSLWKAPALITALFLLIPLLGNQFVDGWNWPPGAFVRFGGLVFGLALTYQFVTRNTDTIAYRAAFALALSAALFVFWGNFVQFVDVNRAAAMYFAVPIVAIIGAILARLQPAGMARALFVTALAQGLVLAIALIIRNPELTPWTPPVLRGFVGNALFLMLFVGSALLFRKAGKSSTGLRVAF